MDTPTLKGCAEDWAGLTQEFHQLEITHKKYTDKLKELRDAQNSCLKEITHQEYRMKQISNSIRKTFPLQSHGKNKKEFGKNVSEEDKATITRIKDEMIKRTEQIRELEEYLPRRNGLYLRIILGNVGVSLMNKDDKFRYKDEFEKFKLIVTAIGVVVSFVNMTLLNSRFMDLAFMFLLVWYYCTLTIRESILKVNGSRIKGWWRAHHFISTVLSGIFLIWPDTPIYYMFRKQFMIFNCYIGLVQYLQFRYQQGCLYRLKALGQRHNMDVTIEGFHSWMWKGLSFLLPFLYVGYFFQLYNAYVLYQLSYHPLRTEWQVPVLSGFFFLLFLGNIITTSMVVPQKLKEKITLKYRYSKKLKSNGKSKETINGEEEIDSAQRDNKINNDIVVDKKEK